MPVETKKRRTILVPADLDETSLRGFQTNLDGLLGEPRSEIALDCSLLRRASSSHINTLWEAQTRCEDAQVRMVLACVRPCLERILRILDLYELFTIESETDVDRPHERPGVVSGGSGEGLSIDLRASADGIRVGLDKLREYLIRSDASDVCVFDLETVFYEIATNISRHSGLDGADLISFEATQVDGKISMRFCDHGRPFDPTGKTAVFDPGEAIKAKQRRGIGLTLIKRLVDGISYERLNDGSNVVVLDKRMCQRRRKIQ
jgi:anti-sigma regulatory factor (Ser/Thr protein kinase)/anti-anti-sigma regulatory factor